MKPLAVLIPWLLPLWLLSAADPTPAAAPPRVLIFGEQHDQPDEQRQVADAVRELAAQGRLGALVLEMADAPYGTSGLPRDADAQQVRAALHWHGWPWASYEAVVMNAVRAGVPVHGGNLPRSANAAAMNDASLDEEVDSAAHATLAEAVRAGHCGLLPASQIPGMVRIQIARDRSIADAVGAALQGSPPPRQVLLLTGAQHASRDHGVPIHLLKQGLHPADIQVVMFGDRAQHLAADEWRPAVFTPREDPCLALKRQLEADAAASQPARGPR